MPSGWGAGVFWGFRPIVTASVSADWHLNVRANSFEICQLNSDFYSFLHQLRVSMCDCEVLADISRYLPSDHVIVNYSVSTTHFSTVYTDGRCFCHSTTEYRHLRQLPVSLPAFLFFAVISSFLRLRGAQHWDPIGPCILFVTWENRVQDRRLGISRPRGVGKGGQGGHVPYYKSEIATLKFFFRLNSMEFVTFNQIFSIFFVFWGTLPQTISGALCLYGPRWWRNPLFCPPNNFLATPLSRPQTCAEVPQAFRWTTSTDCLRWT